MAGSRLQVLVIGAGVVGLASARALAKAGHDVVVAEAASAIGTGVSSRNSEVIHAGLYYPADSLRARHCVRGRRLLYAYCGSRGVAHRRCGKLVVATDAAELELLAGLHARARVNGVEGLELLDGAAARALEPELRCVGALLSPETGIVDAHGFLRALRGELDDLGAAVALRTQVASVSRSGRRWRARFFETPDEGPDFDAVVNCAGLGAQAVARRTEGYPPERVPPLVLAKGSYFACAGRPAFTRLVYPAPVDGGLGVHLTLDLAGRMRFGPDVEWVEREDYAVDPGRVAAFYSRIRTYWPALLEGALTPDFAGIRPKLSGPGEPPRDFVIDGPAEHGLPRLVQLFGIESPGLTAALSLAEEVVARVET